MAIDDLNIPDNIKRTLRRSLLNELQGTSSFDVFELELFEWYVRETDELIEKMLAAERDYIQGQSDTEQDLINDSGIVAAEYYLKRVRYSHVIYLTSIVETFLARECERLVHAIGEHSVPFKLAELSGNQWEKKRKFLERYGKFTLSNEVWRDVHDLITVRNIIVHNNGAVSDLNEEHRRRLVRHSGIALTESELSIKTTYVTEAFASVKKLCDEIEREINKAIGRAICPVSVGAAPK